jgi:hypothetical protein
MKPRARGGAPPPEMKRAASDVTRNTARKTAAGETNRTLWTEATQPCVPHLAFRQLDFAKLQLEKGIREIFGGTPEKVERALCNAKSSIGDALRLIEYDASGR